MTHLDNPAAPDKWLPVSSADRKHVARAADIVGWLPVTGNNTTDTAQLEVARAPEGYIALRNSFDPFGPALVLHRSAIYNLNEAIRTGAIDALLDQSIADHPFWCTAKELPGQRHRSPVLLGHGPDDLTEVRVRISRSPEPNDYEHVMLSAEEADGNRKRLILSERRVARFIAVMEELESLFADPTTQTLPDGTLHPRWCLGIHPESSDTRHMSAPLFISDDGADQAFDCEIIHMGLVHIPGPPGGEDGVTVVHLYTQNEDDRSCWPLMPHQLPLIRHALTEVIRWRSRDPDEQRNRDDRGIGS